MKIIKYQNLNELHKNFEDVEKTKGILLNIGDKYNKRPIKIELEYIFSFGVMVENTQIMETPLGVTIQTRKLGSILFPSTPVIGYAEISQEFNDKNIVYNFPFFLPLIGLSDKQKFSTNEISLAKLSTNDFFLTGYR